MDYETKIYLDKLIEAVEELNSPDWWIIGITAINAMIMIWLGYNQYKLQKRQTKAVEFETYQALYNFIIKANKEIEAFMLNVCCVLWESDRGSSVINNRLNSIYTLRNELDQNEIEFELKLSHNIFNSRTYYHTFGLMLHTLQSVKTLLKDDDLYFEQNMPQLYFEEKYGDKDYAQDFITHIKRQESKELFEKIFKAFIEQKSLICDKRALKRFSKRCNIG